MTPNDYLAEQNRILDQLDARTPSSTGPMSWSTQQRVGHMMSWAVPVGLIGIAYGATQGAMAGFRSQSILLGTGSGLVAIFAAIASLVYFSNVANVEFRNGVAQELSEALLTRTGPGIALTPRQNERLAGVVEAYPRLVDTCARWAASNPQGVLSSKDVLALFKAADQLDSLKETFQKYEKSRQKMHEVGLTAAIQASVQQAQLTQSTPPVAPTAPKPRF